MVLSALAVVVFVRLAAWSIKDEAAEAWMDKHAPFAGVNLGGWLILERWLVGAAAELNSTCCGPIPSPYHADGVAQDAIDEFTLTAQLRAAGQLSVIDVFRASRVSLLDFEAMAQQGVTSVRVPFPWWIVQTATEAGSETWNAGVGGYHIGQGLSILDNVVSWAEATRISLLLELHAAPGGQSSAQTTGRSNPDWQPSQFDANAALKALQVVALRYNRSAAVVAISPLNEPTLPTSDLVQFYRRAYDIVRASGMRPKQVAFVVQLYGLDALWNVAWPILHFDGGLPSTSHPNVVFDLHLYYGVLVPPLPQIFDRLASPAFLVGPFVALQSAFLDLAGRPAFVGEWSLRTPYYEGGHLPRRFNAQTPHEQNATMHAFAENQLRQLFGPSSFVAWLFGGRRYRAGGYFWSWGDAPQEESCWSLQISNTRGWLRPVHAWAALRDS